MGLGLPHTQASMNLVLSNFHPGAHEGRMCRCPGQNKNLRKVGCRGLGSTHANPFFSRTRTPFVVGPPLLGMSKQNLFCSSGRKSLTPFLIAHFWLWVGVCALSSGVLLEVRDGYQKSLEGRLADGGCLSYARDSGLFSAPSFLRPLEPLFEIPKRAGVELR